RRDGVHAGRNGRRVGVVAGRRNVLLQVQAADDRLWLGGHHGALRRRNGACGRGGGHLDGAEFLGVLRRGGGARAGRCRRGLRGVRVIGADRRRQHGGDGEGKQGRAAGTEDGR